MHRRLELLGGSRGQILAPLIMMISLVDQRVLLCGCPSSRRQLYASLFSHVDTRLALGKAEWLRVHVYNARSRVNEGR